MTIEKELARIADGIEKLGAALASGAAAAQAAAPAEEEEQKPSGGKKGGGKKAEEKKGPSKEDVRKALKDYGALEGKEAAIKILNEVGEAASMSELDESKYQAVLDAIEEAG